MKKLLFTLLVLACTSVCHAQKIDINFYGRAVSEGTAIGYSPWTFGRLVKAVGNFPTPDSLNTVHIEMTCVPGLDGNGVRDNYWKTGVVNYGYKLLGDGAYVINLDHPEGGSNDYKDVTSQAGIQLRVSGLPAGSHTLMCFHNFTNDWPNIPPINTYVNGKLSEEGIQQTCRATKESESALSYSHFSVTGPEDTVTIQYIAQIAAGKAYNNYGVSINALVFDQPNPFTTALDPNPTNQDWHVVADNGEYTLSWKPAAKAVKHHIMMGTESGKLTEIAQTTDSFYTVKDLYSMNFYYWRIDEEDASGNRYESEEWSFRPRHLAFPGAEGYGRYATGGRGGVVYHVTTLEDSKNPTPGMLRYGLKNLTGPRTIVFDVAGYIKLVDRLTISDPFITIAGQTAPGNGITMRDRPFGVGNEGITRFVRLRLGGADDWDGIEGNKNTADGMGCAGGDHAIVDHCSISWTIDESFSSRNAKNLTFQNNLIAEALTYAGHNTQFERHGYHVNHGYAGSISGDVGSFHHNLIAHCQGRNWSMAGGLDNSGYAGGRLDLVNNVVYNWNDRTTDGGAHEVQFMGNYYKMGIDTKLTTYILTADLENVGKGTQSYYVKDNIRENKNGTISRDKLNDTYHYQLYAGKVLDWEVFVSKPFWESYITIDKPEDAFKKVLSFAGCNSPILDNHDERMVDETLYGKTSKIGWHSKLRGLIDRESESEGWTGLNVIETQREAGYDTDQDGIPNWFENTIGSDPNVANNNDDEDKDGYTLLEDYLEYLSHPHFVCAPNGQLAVDVTPYFRGFVKTPVFTVSTDSPLLTPSVSGSMVTVQAGSQQGVATVVVEVTDSEGTTFKRNLNIAVSNDPTSIESLPIDIENAESVEVYTIDGKQIAKSQMQTNQVYIMKMIDSYGNNRSVKVIKR